MKIITIGAGLGGLAASCLLAAEGHDVTILEKNARPGGKINELRAHGFRFDTGPSLLTMPFVLKSLFEKCGTSLENHLTIEAVNPICRYFFSNGTRFDSFQDPEVNIAQIQQFAPDDVQAYKKFMRYSQDLYEKTKEAFLFNPLYDLSDLGTLPWTDFFRIDAFKTVAQRVDRAFQSTELQKFFKRFTTYNGSSPYQAPATLNIIPYVELGLGGYYIKGGMYQLIEALCSLAERLGITIATETEIRKINLTDNHVTGVVDYHGQAHSADIVISNAGAHETYLNMLSEVTPRGKEKRLKKLEPSCSGFVLMLGIDKTYEQLSHHNIFFSEDYEHEFNQIFRQKTMPEDPTIYVANSSHSDPNHAPAGGSNLFILVNAPYLDGNNRWDEQASDYKKVLIEKLESRGLNNLSHHIKYAETITPADFYQRYRSNRGSIYGTSSNSRLAAFLRPRNKSRAIKGLYLVGGSTHPGGGIPLVVLSAFHATELISRYHKA